MNRSKGAELQTRERKEKKDGQGRKQVKVRTKATAKKRTEGAEGGREAEKALRPNEDSKVR